MKKSIEVKGAIKVSKDQLNQTRGGSCAQYGTTCTTDLVKATQMELEGAVAVDRLYIV